MYGNNNTDNTGRDKSEKRLIIRDNKRLYEKTVLYKRGEEVYKRKEEVIR